MYEELKSLRARLDMLEGSLVSPCWGGVPGGHAGTSPVESWYEDADALRRRIGFISRRVEAVEAWKRNLQRRSRYDRRYYVMLRLVESVYIGGVPFGQFARESGMNERTLWRRRDEAVNSALSSFREAGIL